MKRFIVLFICILLASQAFSAGYGYDWPDRFSEIADDQDALEEWHKKYENGELHGEDYWFYMEYIYDQFVTDREYIFIGDTVKVTSILRLMGGNKTWCEAVLVSLKKITESTYEVVFFDTQRKIEITYNNLKNVVLLYKDIQYFPETDRCKDDLLTIRPADAMSKDDSKRLIETISNWK